MSDPTKPNAASHDPVDRILDVCLAEAVGGHAPPDLTEQVLSKLASRLAEQAQPNSQSPRSESPRSAAKGETQRPKSRFVADEMLPPQVDFADAGASASPDAAVASRSRGDAVRPTVKAARRGSRRSWIAAAAACGIALSVLAAFFYSGYLPIDGILPDDPVVVAPPATGTPGGSTPANGALVGNSHNNTPATQDAPEDDPTVGQGAVAQSGGQGGRTPGGHIPGSPTGNAVAGNSTGEKNTGSGNETPRNPKAPSSSSSDADVIAAIDSDIRQGWLAAGVKPAEPASDGEWCRRVFLDIIGRIPTADELQEFAADRSQHRRRNLVDKLLGSDDYVEEYARNWTNIWTNLLVGRSDSAGMELLNREGLRHYLRRSLLKNKPFDEMTRELLAATGSNRPGDADFNGAVNFLLAHSQEKATPATTRISQVFLGVQVQCTQCHNHPVASARQNQFWELNSFLRQMRTEVVEEQGKVVAARLLDGDFLGESGQTPDEAEVYYEQRNGLMKVAYPVFLDGEQVSPSGRLADVNRRQELARLVANSPNLSLSFVNRMWAHFLGYGFTRPIDDLGPHNPPSHAKLFERLAGEFRGHGYDMRQMIRWITLSRPYSLSSKPPVGPAGGQLVLDDPRTGQQPLFSRFYLRQMRPEELYESMLAATQVDRAVGEVAFHQAESAKSEWMQQFTFNLRNDENRELTAFNGSITQTLDLWNGGLVTAAVSGNRGTFLHEVATSESKENQKIQRLFLTALGRQPTNQELKTANEVWRRRQGNTAAALQDIWWALLNSNEFILNH